MSKLLLKHILTSLIFIPMAFGATFIPTPIEDQVDHSYGVIHGKFVSKTYKKLKTGEVVTEATIKINSSSGIKNSEIINKNNFKVLYPGGTWQGIVYKVQGAPNFSNDEEVVLLINKGKFGFAVSNLGMGKYKVVNKLGRKHLVSSIFPNHPKIGKISFEDFNDIVLNTKGASLQKVNKDKFVYRGEERDESFYGQDDGRRGPASISERTKESESTLNVFWLVLLFATLGGYSAFAMRKNK